MKITIEGWKEEPIVIDDIEELIISTISTEGKHSYRVKAAITHQVYFARMLKLVSDKYIKLSI